MNNNGTINDMVMKFYGSGLISAAEKYFNDLEIIKCAKELKDVFKDFNKLKNIEQRAAAVLLAEKMLEEESKNNR